MKSILIPAGNGNDLDTSDADFVSKSSTNKASPHVSINHSNIRGAKDHNISQLNYHNDKSNLFEVRKLKHDLTDPNIILKNSQKQKKFETLKTKKMKTSSSQK